MQKSKIFLSGTALLLAIAGAFATKVSKVSKPLTAYTQGDSECNKVVLYFSSTTINSGNLNKRHVFARGLNKTVYTRGNPSKFSCGNTIYTIIN